MTMIPAADEDGFEVSNLENALPPYEYNDNQRSYPSTLILHSYLYYTWQKPVPEVPVVAQASNKRNSRMDFAAAPPVGAWSCMG